MHTQDIEAFVGLVLDEGRRLYRDLPWRNTRDPYRILVSEVMLQQTQVSRVLKYWERFVSLFPTIDALAAADTAFVLEQWQGLGYNRRALGLKKTADICSASHGGELPKEREALLALPGIGDATASGVRIFAHDRPEVYIETNVRTVFIHELFPDADAVSDKELRPLVEAACPAQDPRTWYYALLDYGSHLKQQVANPSRRSAHYSRQSAFEGSKRQKRAELLRYVLDEPGIDGAALAQKLDGFEGAHGRSPVGQGEFEAIVGAMVKEGFFRKEGDCFYAG